MLHHAGMIGPHAEQAGGSQVDRPGLEIAARALRADLEPGVIGVGAILAPVEPRMGVEDHQPAHEHDEHGDDIGPMPQAGGEPMALDEVTAARFGRDYRFGLGGGFGDRVGLVHAQFRSTFGRCLIARR